MQWVNPFSANCFIQNVVCFRYSSVIQTSLLSWSWKQSLWTRIRLILREQSYLGLLQYAFKSFASRLKSGGYSSKPLVIFFSILYIFFKTKIGQSLICQMKSKAQNPPTAASYEFLWVAYQSFYLVIPNTALCTCLSYLIFIIWYHMVSMGRFWYNNNNW